MSPKKLEPVAVVGVSALFPGSLDKTGFWNDILAGTDRMSAVPASHWLVEDYYDPNPSTPDKTYANRGGFIPDVEFDPMAWGIPPSIVPATDTAQLLSLIVAKQVLDDAAQGQFQNLDRERMSCILGVTSAQELLSSMVGRLQRPVWVKALREHGLPESEVQAVCARISSNYVDWQESTFPGLLGNVVAGRIANRLDLGGTNCVTDAACASSFAALSMALNELHLGQSDLVICGGADTMNDIFMYMCFSKTPALSPSGDCRPFSDKADGTMLGEGFGMVALKRLSDAEAQGDRIYALVTAVGASSDGRAKSVYAPVSEGQAKALRRAYAQAGYGPDTVDLVEAHGTGTKAGDAAEFGALCTVFDESGRMDRQWCQIGSVKSQIGHTKAAAGAAGLVKAVFALHHKVLPPTIKVDHPNPKLELAQSPFHVTTRARPWPRSPDHPRRASVSSFGFGGSNFHVALEEYAGTGKKAFRLRTTQTELVLVAGSSAAEVATKAAALAKEVGTPGMLRFVARTTQQAFDASARARLAIVASSDADLADKLASAAALVRNSDAVSQPAGIHFEVGEPDGDVGFLFPGQGSQHLDMGASLAMTFDAAGAAWDVAASLSLAANATLPEVVFPRTAFTDAEKKAQQQRLTATEWAQPAIGAASLALLRIMRALGVTPACVAGHSYGEITALHAADVIGEQDLLRVARKRGELMRDAASKPGSMTAVTAGVEALRPLLAAWLASGGIDVVLANHNSPDQVVLSGTTEAIAAAEQELTEARLPFTRLNVATAFHSKVVSDSVAPFRAFLDSVAFGAPSCEVYGTATAAPYPRDAAAMRALLADQIASPVRFLEQIEAMYARGVRTFVEVGPGAVLTGLVGRILEARPHRAIALDRAGSDSVTSLHRALARLATAGVRLRLSALWDAFAPTEDPRTSVKPKLTLKINGANYGKPYPPKGGAAALPRPNPERSLETARTAVVAPAPVAQRAPLAPLAQAPPIAATATATAWLDAYQQAQLATTQAHASYQKAMAETHSAFLRSTEASMLALASMMTGARATTPSAELAPAARAAFATPMPILVPAPTPMPAPSAPASAGVDMERLMLAVVSEKTGYPVEMLALGMDLEADLGIDSIKRVEILSAMRERAPALPDVDTGQMARMRTLGQIVEHMRAGSPASPIALVAPVAAAPATPRAGGAAVGADLERLMLAVVSEKTGYPVEMLALGMDLEADLGIDSIKRVEILSAMRERAPALPDVDTGQMARMRTLGQIVEHMRAGSLASAPVAFRPSGAAPAVVASRHRDEVARYALRLVTAKAAGFALSGLLSCRRLVVTDEGTGLAEALARGLTARGLPAEVRSDVPADADGVIFLGGLRQVSDIDAAIAVNKEAFRAARAVAPRLGSQGGVFVTVQDTGGDFGLHGSARAWLGGLPGLVKTAAQEWPRAALRAIDLERGERRIDALADAIIQELLAGGIEVEVGLHADGRRVTLESFREDVAKGEPLAHAGSVIVAAGGARGVTAATLVTLAERTKCRIVLLGRTALQDEPASCRGATSDADLKRALLAEAKARGAAITPGQLGASVATILANREVRGTLDAIGAAGGAARYLVVDVQDADAVRGALADVRSSWGPITGIVHGAGVLADKLIADKTDEQFDRVFDTKVNGLRALLSATADDPLDLLVMFSSVAARCGNQGQCDYAMANEVLNKVAAAERARRGDLIAKSFNWGPWEGGMVTPQLRARFAQLGVPLIPLSQGAAMTADELTRARPEQSELVIGGEPRARPLLSDGGDGSVTRLEIFIDRTSHSYLDGHRVKGTPVVPMALALEWFARAAKACRPELTLVGMKDVKVWKGILLHRFAEGGDLFTLTSTRVTNGRAATYAVELSAADGTRHYAATALLERESPTPPTGGAPALAGLTAWTAPIYGDVLFHGKDFQVIRTLDGISAGGVTASLVGTEGVGWTGDGWRIDPALLDGGLQLALLWTQHTLGGASLPTGLSGLRVFREGLSSGLLRAVLTAREAKGDRGVCDVLFLDRDGRALAELVGVETHVLRATRPTAT